MIYYGVSCTIDYGDIMGSYDIGNVSVSLLGHATVMVVSGDKVIYIDPYKVPESSKVADIILVTHEHYDHCDPEVIRQLSDNNTKIIAAKGCASKIDGDVTETAPGDSLAVDDVSIKAVQAYNISKQYHPKGLGIGYIIDVGGVKIYHAGDTDRIPEMKSLKDENIDIAFLPAGGTFTMDIEEASDAAADIMPKVVVPMHYGVVAGTQADTEKFKTLVAEKAQGVDVRIL